jgi:hypothetical protein
MKTNKSDHPHASDTPAGAFAVMLNGPAADAVEKSAAMIGKSVKTFQQESMRFFTQRLEDNAKAAKEFAACANLTDVMSLQQKWFADMTRAYSDEWVRYGELMMDVLEKKKETEDRDGRPSAAHTRGN